MTGKYGSRTVKGSCASFLVVLNVVCCPATAAQKGDVFVPYVEYTGNYSDNLLKLDSETTALARFGDDQLSDTYTRTVGGLRFDQTWGRQRITADLSANRNHYDHFSQFDYSGKNGKANWNWVVGNHLQGNLSSVYEQTLAPFDSYVVFARNLLTRRTNNADLAWLVHPSWELRTAFNRYDLVYSAPSLAASNTQADTAELGFNYLARSGSTAGLVFRNVRGIYDTTLTIGDQLFNNNYVQKELKLSVSWLVTGKSSLQFLGGPVQRRRAYFTARDYTGFNARLSGFIPLTGKLSLYGSVWRELGGLDDLTANYALTDGISLFPSLAISSKLKLDGSTTYQRRNYSGAQVIEGLTPSNRRDTYTRTSLGLTYKVGPALSIVTSLSREKVDSNLANFNFRANGAALKVRYEY
jgi:exopolysaccharide biosynthesis operon protein EpsL